MFLLKNGAFLEEEGAFFGEMTALRAWILCGLLWSITEVCARTSGGMGLFLATGAEFAPEGGVGRGNLGFKK